MKHSFAGSETRPFSSSRMDFLAARAAAPALRLPTLLEPNMVDHTNHTN